MAIDITKLVTLVEDGHEAEAQELVKNYLLNLTSEERGEMYLSIGSIYFELMAKNEKKLADALVDQLEALKILRNEEALVTDEVNLADIRSQLNS